MERLDLCIIGNLLGRNPGFATTQGQILADLLSVDGHVVVSVSSKINRLSRLFEIVRTVIAKRKNVDILMVEVYSGANFIVADIIGSLGRLFRIPMIFVLHGGNLPQLTRLHPRWARRVLDQANILVAPSKFLRRELRELGMSIRVVHNIVDLPQYPFKLRQEVAPRLLWMRAFHDLYRPQMAVRVLDVIIKKYPNATLVMAGVDKGLEPEIKKMGDDLGLSEALRFPGFLEHRAKIEEFSNADIFLNTNHVDNMPVAVIEARAMGLPVVATSVGGIPYMITNGEDGLLVPDSDVDAMAAAIVALLENPELAGRISKNGRKVAERSSWEKVRADWEKLFDEILETTSHVTTPQVSH